VHEDLPGAALATADDIELAVAVEVAEHGVLG